MSLVSLPDVLVERIMWAVFFLRGCGAATICRGQLVNKQWQRCYKSIDPMGRKYMMWILTPSYVPNNPALVDRLAYCEPSRSVMIENRKRASRQSKVAKNEDMKLDEWRRYEAKRLKTTVKAIKNGCKGTVQ